MNAILIQIIVALYSFIVTNPQIPQSVKDQALQVVGQNASAIQIPAVSCSQADTTSSQSDSDAMAVPEQPTNQDVSTTTTVSNVYVRPTASYIDVPNWDEWTVSSSSIDATVYGTGFIAGDTVSITGPNLNGYVPVTVNSVSPDGTQIDVTLPAGLVDGLYGYYVYTQDGSPIYSPSTGFGLQGIDD